MATMATITTRPVHHPWGFGKASSASSSAASASPSPPPMVWPPPPTSNHHKTTRAARRLSQPLPTLSSAAFDRPLAESTSTSSPPSPSSLPDPQPRRPGTALSPPPTPVAQKTFPSSADRNASEPISVHRLRSNSGLALHTSCAALRRYIDYNPDGSTRLEAMDEAPPSSTIHTSSDEATHSGSASSSRGTSPVLYAPPGLYSRDTVLAVLQDPVTRGHLWEFARSRSNEETLEFLQKVEEYNQAVHGVVALLATISTKYTGLAATQSLKLPQQLKRSLNADVMHISRSVLPGLEMLFGEVTSYIEDHIVRDIYPAFVRHQLSLRMKALLSPPSHRPPPTHPPFRFSGLGHAFCLTDPHQIDNPVVFASDSFARIIGYPCAEDIPRSGRCLSGIQQNDWREIKEETTEDIVLNRRHWDRQPFWSYVSECPLQSPRGCTRFSLVSLVDMSDVVKSQDGILKALRCDSCTTTTRPRPASKGNPSTHVHVEERAAHPSPKWSKWSGTAKPAGGLSKSFMMPFSRKQRLAEHDDPSSSGLEDLMPVAIQYQPKLPASSDTLVSVHPDGNLPMYSRFMLLQMTPGQAEGNDVSVRSAAASMASTTAVARLKVAFCSAPMLEMLGLTAEGQDAVLYYDVFAVLANLAGSYSIAPNFRQSVYQHMDAVEYASLEFSIPVAGSPAASGLSTGLGIGLSSPVRQEARGGTTDGLASRRPGRFLFGRTKKGGSNERTTSKATAASDARRHQTKRKQRVMSHWTPLKDALGSVEWVVLVISPTLS